ncbi:Uncharacterised protein [Shigella flexneri]|nr:Uncharacterised protein [Shigella sonnei]SRN47478.1 Uncharacterised protein [Shigella flexneri]
MRSVQIDGVALPAIEFLYSLVACDNDRWHQKWSAQLALAARPSVVGDTVREDESDFARCFFPHDKTAVASGKASVT